MKGRIEILHGVNLDVLGRRPASHYGGLTLDQLGRRDATHYGGLTLDELQFRIDGFADELDLDARFFQTNHEGEMVEELHKASDYADSLLVNPGAWTHYSWALRDAVEVSGLPAVEVHLSDVTQREEFRRVSVFEGIVVAKVFGKGVEGYREALATLKGVF